jgi:hypothetical protein
MLIFFSYPMHCLLEIEVNKRSKIDLTFDPTKRVEDTCFGTL